MDRVIFIVRTQISLNWLFILGDSSLFLNSFQCIYRKTEEHEKQTNA